MNRFKKFVEWLQIVIPLSIICIVIFSITFIICESVHRQIKNDYAEQVSYYENGIKIDALEYQNKLYIERKDN